MVHDVLHPGEVGVADRRCAELPAPVVAQSLAAPVGDVERRIEEHRVEGQTVRVYSVARTVADCFRFRNKIGLDVALEALADAWGSKRFNLDELNRIARKLRVQRVMQPYLEAVVM